MKRPPNWLWLLAAGIAALRALPFFATLLLTPPSGQAYLQVGYMPEDMHAYLGFARQVVDDGAFLFENPYVSTEQSGRFILLYHWALGAVAAATGIAPQWLLELSRIPLIFGFLWTVWWFLEPIFKDRPTGVERTWATVLIGLGGGIDGFLRPIAKNLPETLGKPFLVDTWHLYGWSTFQSLYNPLWIAGLTLTLFALKPLLQVDGAKSGANRTSFNPWTTSMLLAVILVVLFFVHPYSALVVFAIGCGRPLVELAVEGSTRTVRVLRDAVGLGVAFSVIGAIAFWQRADPVFAAASQEFFGRLHLPAFWYPLTFGALLWLALAGGARWMEERHPYRSSLIAWVGVVVLLHTSNLVNGYHFILYLHIPLAILAAPAMSRLFSRLGQGARLARLAWAALLVLVFASPLLVTLESVTDLRERNLVPAVFLETTAVLAELPQGRVLAPPKIGLVIPAYTHHRVWAGHWFLTPDYWPKVELYAQLVSDPA
ncbi:MAG: hypothetical protein OES47_12985, partial [Acidobacteriota bacterium]|nr:hypothetical protein [Acidobacteriota bacterium]